LMIGAHGGALESMTTFFKIPEPAGEFYAIVLRVVSNYSFNYYEDLFAEDAKAPTPVNVLTKTYRNVQLFNPGQYDVVFTYNGGMTTKALWEVMPLSNGQTAKNLIFFVGENFRSRLRFR
jgi:hypothetical protein